MKSRRGILLSKAILLCITILSLQPFAATEFDVKNFGAVGDGSTLNTKAIQKAIDSCAKTGGGTILFSTGSFMSGTIYLKSNVTLNIASGATLLASKDINQYTTDTYKTMYKGESVMDRCFIFAQNAKNIGLTGKGTINGSGGSFSSSRPMLIRCVSCTTVTVRGLNLLNPASWTSAYLYCKNVVFDSINVSSRANGNGDGADFDGCEDVVVSNCTFDCSDDAVCLQTSRKDKPARRFKMFNCNILSTTWAGMRFGLLSVGDFDSVEVYACKFAKMSDATFKIQICEGAKMSNFNFHDIEIANAPRLTLITLNSYRFSRLESDAGRGLPAISSEPFKNIKFTNIKLTNPTQQDANSYILLAGIPNNTINNIEFNGISFVAPGGGTSAQAAKRNLPEITGKRPEVTIFSTPLPAFGAYLHHTRNITFRNSQFKTLATDARSPILGEDADSTKFINVHFQGTPICPNSKVVTEKNNAQNATVTTSSNSDAASIGSKAVDGDIATGWKSANTDNESMVIDLKKVYSVNRVVLWWNTDFAKSFTIQTAQDTTHWNDAFTTTHAIGGINDIPVYPVNARYIKFVGKGRGTTSGYSLNELEVYGGDSMAVSTNPFHVKKYMPTKEQKQNVVLYSVAGKKIRSFSMSNTMSVQNELQHAGVPAGSYIVRAGHLKQMSTQTITICK